AVGIDLDGVEPFWLEENLMALLIGEAHDLILDRWAIARPAAVDDPGINRRAVQRSADRLVRFVIGVRDVTRHLLLRDLLGRERERRGRIVAVLDLEPLKVDRARVETRACARL